MEISVKFVRRARNMFKFQTLSETDQEHYSHTRTSILYLVLVAIVKEDTPPLFPLTPVGATPDACTLRAEQSQMARKTNIPSRTVRVEFRTWC